MNRPSGRRGGSNQGPKSAGRRTDDRNDSRPPSRPNYSRSRDDRAGSGPRGGNRPGDDDRGPRSGGSGFNKDRFISRSSEGGDNRRDDRFNRGDRDDRRPNRGFEGRDNRGPRQDGERRSFGDRDQRGGFGNRDNRGGFGDRDNRDGFGRADRPDGGDNARGQRNQKASDRYPRNNDRNRFGNDRPPRRDDDRGPRSFDRGGSERPGRSYGGPDRGPRNFDRDERPNRSFGGEGRQDRGPREYGNRPQVDRPQGDRPSGFNRGGDRPDRRFESRPYERRDRPERSNDRGPRSFDRGNDRPNRFGNRENDRDQSPNRDTFTGGSRDSFAENATKRTYSRMRQNEDRMKRQGEEVPTDLPEKPEDQEMRLNRYIASSGICSRREADTLIAQGSITVNGKTITEMGHRVEPGDKVEYGGKLLRPEKYVYVLMNKPKDYITTKEDEEGRRTVMDLLEGKIRERIYPVGRLDRNTTGLLLFTNDGEMAERLMHPSFEIKKIYQVDLDRPLSPADFDAIKHGLVLEDGPARVDDIAVLSPDRKIVGLEIHIGRNRIVRRIFEHLGYTVQRLDRVMYGGLTKKDLPRGKWRFLTPQEIMNLKYYA